VNYDPSQETFNEEEVKDSKINCFYFIIDQMFNDSSSWPFKDPVSPDVAPDYSQVIENPIDLTTMR